jgi:hypothetical protein
MKEMMRSRILALALVSAFASTALAGEMVGVSGSDTRFAATTELNIKGQPLKLTLTGTALRKKYLFNVYAMASYVQEGAGVHNAQDLAAADVPKILHLVMERDVDGATMAGAFREAVRLNHAAPAFEQELNTLAAFLQANGVKKGDHVWLTHVPGVGFHVRVGADKTVFIPNPAFSRAAWDAYLGANNLGEAIKAGLTSRL